MIGNRQSRVNVEMEVRLDGGTISTGTLLNLEAGDVLELDYPLDRSVTALLNGEPKFWGDIEVAGRTVVLNVASEHERD